MESTMRTAQYGMNKKLKVDFRWTINFFEYSLTKNASVYLQRWTWPSEMQKTRKMELKLIYWCFMARQHKIRQFVPGGLLAQAFEDRQQGSYKNIQLHAIQWTYTCNDKQQVYLTCLKINNAPADDLINSA